MSALKCRSCGAPSPDYAVTQAHWGCEFCSAPNETPASALVKQAAAPAAAAPRPVAAGQMVHCRGCGNTLHVSAVSCPKCGAPQQAAQASALPAGVALKSRTTAILLAFFLGGFGAHKFYCGKTGLGFLYLIFFWTYVPAIIALIEFILYLATTKNDAEFTQKYCT
jgi:TM2 domain-containing membrane protein YozV